MPASTTHNWQVIRDSARDATQADAANNPVLGDKYEYLGAAYVQRGDEILVFVSSNIPDGGHSYSRDDGRIGHGVAFINTDPQKGISADNNNLVAVRFGDHHTEVAPEYRKAKGAFTDFTLDSVTGLNNRVSNFTLGDYVGQITDLGGEPSQYGESARVDNAYLGGLGNAVSNEITGGSLIQDSGYRELTDAEVAEARSRFSAQNIGGDYVHGFAISKDLLPVGEVATLSLWAECANDGIAMDIVHNGSPEIAVIKRVNGLDANTPTDAATVEAGQKIVYSVEVANTGDVEIPGSEITVDDPDAVLSRLPFTDVGADGILSPGEVWSYVAAPAQPAENSTVTIDFDYAANGDPILRGDKIDTQYASLGLELISAEYTYNPEIAGLESPAEPSQEAVDRMFIEPFGPMAFDSENYTGEDPDLATTDQGMVLIISEDGDQSDPDDNYYGGTFFFDFTDPVLVSNLGVLDLNDNLGLKGFLNGQEVGSAQLGIFKPEEQDTVDLTEIFSTPIDRLAIDSRDSFALTELSFTKPVENTVTVTVQDSENRFEVSVSDSAYYNYESDSAFTPGPRTDVISEPEPEPPVQGKPDFNGDGHADLLWHNAVSGAAVAWFMEDSAVLGAAILGTVADANWALVGSGDFNGDDQADLIWQHKLTGDAVAWFMDGDAPTGSASFDLVADPTWHIVGAADFNGDGKTDLLQHNSATGEARAWYLDGASNVATTNIGSASLGAVPDLNWKLVGDADVNGDGSADLLWHHGISGDAVAWLMDGSTVTSSVALGTVADANWMLMGASDLNNDGSADLLWRHRVSGENVGWLMDGTTTAGSVALNTVPDQTWTMVV